MSRFLSQLFERRKAGEPSPRDLVLAQRERLLGCALQLLQDGTAAQEVVLKALTQALQSPLLVPLAGPDASSGEGAAALTRWLDRLIVNLSLAHLRQRAPVRPGARGGDGVEGGGDRPLLEVLRRGPIPTSPPPLRPSRPPPLPAPATRAAPASPPERGTPSGGLPVQLSSEARREVQALVPAGAADVTDPGRRAPQRLDGTVDVQPRRQPQEVQQLERLTRALSGLAPETRITLVLVLMQGRSLGEAAELLGCREESCRFWLLHGRKQLRRALQRDLLEGEPDPPPPSADSPTGVLYDLRRGKKATARA